MSVEIGRLMKSIGGMPTWIQIWLAILMSTNMASLAFLDTPVGLWTAVAFAIVCMFNMPMMLIQGGMTRLLSLPHFVWAPLVVFIFLQLHGDNPIPRGTTLHAFAVAVFVVNTISLVFDVMEVYRWFRGRREILGLAA